VRKTYSRLLSCRCTFVVQYGPAYKYCIETKN
jgi:hypothetical protein